MSCRCQKYPYALAPVCDHKRDPNYQGTTVFPQFFQALCLETLKPAVVFGGMTSRCEICGQAWYVELEPEQTPTVAFALKRDDTSRPGGDELSSARIFLLVLAHGGFSTDRCCSAGCNNFALRGRALCHLHWGFPVHS